MPLSEKKGLSAKEQRQAIERIQARPVRTGGSAALVNPSLTMKALIDSGVIEPKLAEIITSNLFSSFGSAKGKKASQQRASAGIEAGRRRNRAADLALKSQELDLADRREARRNRPRRKSISASLTSGQQSAPRGGQSININDFARRRKQNQFERDERIKDLESALSVQSRITREAEEARFNRIRDILGSLPKRVTTDQERIVNIAGNPEKRTVRTTQDVNLSDILSRLL
jgi:hypothetical protein